MLEFLLSMIKFKKSSGKTAAEYQPSDVMVASLSLEREEDGFVMVGETEDERNTVKPGDEKNKESPPSYDLMVKSENDLQTYKIAEKFVNDTQSSNSSSQQVHQRSNVNSATPDDSNKAVSDNMQRSVDDVPFRFHSSIEASLHQDQLVRDISDVIPNIWTNSAEYDYNFFTERAVLEDT